MRRLPVVLGTAHMCFALLVFGLALARPERAAMLPIVMLYVDYPCSILLEQVRHFLHGGLDSFAARMAVDGAVYTVAGSAWYVLLGMALARFVAFVTKRRAVR
jgi:hypothetical protein